MPKQEFPFPMPNGWFCVTRVGDLKNEESKSFIFCEKEVVAFRTKSGKVSVLDAFCGYCGINLAISGKVDGETINCPKHGIKWNIDGTCAEIGKDGMVPQKAMEVETKQAEETDEAAKKAAEQVTEAGYEGNPSLYTPIQDRT